MTQKPIITMKPIPRRDGGVTYIPVRADEPNAPPQAGPLAEMGPGQLVERQAAKPAPIVENLTGDYKSRAIGFSIKTWQVSLIAGLAMWLIARLGAGVPLFSIKAMLALLAGVGVVWFGAYALDLALSPAGVELYKARRMWNFLDREQKERFDYWRETRRGGRHD